MSGHRHSSPTTCGQITTSPSARGIPSGSSSTTVDREREHVGRLVDAEVVALQRAHLVGPDERQPELAVVDALRTQHRASVLDRSALVDRDTAPVVDLDGDHGAYLLRAVPVSSACSR